MFNFKQYIIVVCVTAIIGCIAIAICGNKGSTSAIVKLIVGVMMTLTILKPLVQIEIDNIAKYFSNVDILATNVTQVGTSWAESQSAAIIKEQTEAYIQDKALSMGAQISATVTVEEQAPFSPCSVKLSGNISPYTRNRLSEVIETDLGVKKEHQIWIQ